MPPVSTITSEERPKSSAFTVLNNVDSDLKTEDTTKELSTPLAKNVNIVKPLQREDYEAVKTQNSAAKEEMIERMAAPIGPQTILDPKFTRALDFKLRRLKEKEILQANLRRPTRNRTRIAASNPNISGLESTSPRKTMSQSHPRIDILVPELKISNKISPNFGKSPSPGQKSRKTPASIESCEKPRFITTVKTGQFLLPPPELACLLGLETLYPQADREKIVYSYSSRPKAVASRSKRSIAQEKLPQVHQNDINTHRVHAGNVFSGVRALVAGVVGMKQLVEHSHAHANGSINIPYSNLMHDKRVVRGSTFASHPHAAGDGIDSTAARAARTRRRALAKRAAAARLRPATPPPAPGRKHHPIQTEYYLEELFDKGQEMEIGVQTDLFVDRPATPVYVPAKTGADAFTQIYPGDLFDFDLEVQPILEVLIGKTTEQALAEVAQEEELATLREQQRRFVELRDAERAERERLAAQDMRLHQEKERRVSQARVAQVEAIEARERAAAAVLVQGYIAELLPSVLAGLKEQGYLMEKIERGVDEEFMPWLVQEVSNEIESIITSRDVITEIVRDVVEARAELYRASGDKEAEIPEVEDSVTEPSLPDEGEHEQEPNEEIS